MKSFCKLIISLSLLAPQFSMAAFDGCKTEDEFRQQLAEEFSDWEKLTVDYELGQGNCRDGAAYSIFARNKIISKVRKIESAMRSTMIGEPRLKIKTVDRILLNFSGKRLVDKKWYNPFDNNNMDLMRSEFLQDVTEISELAIANKGLSAEDFSNIYFDPNLIEGGDILIVDDANKVSPEAILFSIQAINKEKIEISSMPTKIMIFGGVAIVVGIVFELVGFALVPAF